jgi:large subunit ribosomal protein L30
MNEKRTEADSLRRSEPGGAGGTAGPPRSMKSKLKVTQLRSVIGRPESHGKVVQGLGLKGPHSVVIVPNQPQFRGMIKKVIHLLHVEEVD